MGELWQSVRRLGSRCARAAAVPGRSFRRGAALALCAAAMSEAGWVRGAAIDLSRLPAPAGRSVDFLTEVRPLFERRCFECHGPEKQKSGFRLDARLAAMRGGDEGVAIVPGKSAESPLIHYVSRLVEDMEMPPKGDPLSAAEIGVLRAWIDQGAVWAEPAGSGPAEDPLDWWSLRPLKAVEPPMVPGSDPGWAEGAIDRLVAARLREKGLDPSPPADRRTFIRRVTYDLLGLPPSPEEVEAFVADRRLGAEERLIDRLLGSPQYGEQWGRHWLDVVRFGESRGYERNEIIRTAWPFRDYVIRSFNQDKPFDRLVLEHLAGDMIGKGDPEVEVGTAFLVAGPYDDVGNQDAAQARIIRANTLDEMVTATASAFLGLTVNCARCHYHKFDPVSMEDYYRFSAVFAGVHHGERTLTAEQARLERAERLKPLEAKRAASEAAIREWEESILRRAEGEVGGGDAVRLGAVNAHGTEDRFEAVEARYVRLNIESNNRNPRDGGNVRIDELEVWTAGPETRNAALASAGAKVSGPTRRAEDFAEAYAPGLVIDGAYGARWISPGAGSLTVELPRVERIDRVIFSADRMKLLPVDSGEIVFVGEYTLEVSEDGKGWRRVADSRERAPVSDAFGRERRLTRLMTDTDRGRRAELQRELDAARAALRKVPELPVVWAGRFEQPKERTVVYKGGDPARPGESVAPGSLSTLARVTRGFELPADAPEGERRLALARWLVQPDNPLTLRVLANRVWQYHFGAGLVETPGDFGKLGTEPSHPELLDWLAGRILHHGWRLKPVHREILLSRTYRQSGKWRAAAAEVDAGSRWLWRFPPRRLRAEEVRDSMLAAADLLDTTQGGPGFQLYRYLQDNVATYLPLDRHGPETYRRAVYHHNARASVVDLMTEFDLPDCAFAAPRRASTTSPLQALSLMNHSFTLDVAAGLAARLERETVGRGSEAPVRRAHEIVYGRPASAEEVREGTAFVAAHGLAAYGRVLFNSNEFLFVE